MHKINHISGRRSNATLFNLKILFIQTSLNPTLSYDKLRTLTDNKVDITFQPFVQLDTIKDYDYIISTGEVPLEPIGTTDYLENIYKVPK